MKKRSILALLILLCLFLPMVAVSCEQTEKPAPSPSTTTEADALTTHVNSFVETTAEPVEATEPSTTQDLVDSKTNFRTATLVFTPIPDHITISKDAKTASFQGIKVDVTDGELGVISTYFPTLLLRREDGEKEYAISTVMAEVDAYHHYKSGDSFTIIVHLYSSSGFEPGTYDLIVTYLDQTETFPAFMVVTP